MASKGQISSESSQSTNQSFIFSGIEFKQNDDILLKGVKVNYFGVENVLKLHQEADNENPLDAIQINVQFNKAAQQFLNQTHLNIYERKYSIQVLPKSLIVFKINPNEKIEHIRQDLVHNYLGIEQVFRFYNSKNIAIDSIRIDFKSDGFVTKILKDKYIFINGKRCPIQPYLLCTYIPNENENKPIISKSVMKNPQGYLTERRVRELFHQQQIQLQEMIDQFEKKWDSRLASLTMLSKNPNTDQLTMIMREFSTISQQFNQQNVQIQRQLNNIVHQINDTQMKINNEHSQQIPLQNGH